MTICEFFKKQYDEAIERGAGTKYVCCINQETAPKGSWEWVKISADYFFGGAYQPQFEKVGITAEQLNEAKEKGFLKYKYYSNWQARQPGQQDVWQLTSKGLKALYKAYQGQW